MGDGELRVETRKVPDATKPRASQDPTAMTLAEIPNSGEKHMQRLGTTT